MSGNDVVPPETTVDPFDRPEPAPPPPPAVDGGPPVVITPMRRRHLRGVMRIDRQVYPRPWSVGLYLGELSRPESRAYVVARAGTAVVGYAGVMVIGDEGHITTVAVDPAWQRRHLGAHLLATVTHRAIALGAAHLTLEVRVGNRGAQEMYRRFGYAPAGVRPRYYAEDDEDALIMWWHDIVEPEQAARLAALESSLRPGVVREGFDRG